MVFEWTPDLVVGVDEIDQQHIEWFKRTNSLLVAIEQDRGKAEVASALEFMEDYARAHLTLEESLMVEHGFLDLTAHQLHHREFLQELAGLKWSLETSRTTSVLAVRMHVGMCNWLTNHIRTFDKGLCAFLKQKGVEVRKLAA